MPALALPADLPPDMRERLLGWLVAAPAAVEGCIQPGCVHLTVDLLLDARWGVLEGAGGGERGVRGAVGGVLQPAPHPDN